jgi:O-antigen/teichoic acid export membrane protein
MKKTVFIGLFAIFQLPAMFIMNYLLIGRYGIYGPAITFAILNTIGLIYGWVIVIKHYWLDK